MKFERPKSSDVAIGHEDGEWFVMFEKDATPDNFKSELNIAIKELDASDYSVIDKLKEIGISNIREGYDDDTKVLFDIPTNVPLSDLCIMSGQIFSIRYREHFDSLVLTLIED